MIIYLRLSSNPQLHENVFENNLIEKEEYDKASLQCETDKPVFQIEVAHR